jgi:PAS domain S-box-containing protein
VYHADGTLVGIRGVSRDVTERMVLDTQLRESEAKFRMVAEAMAIPVFLGRGTRMLYVNAAGMRMLGYTESELLAMPFWQILHPEDRPIVVARAEARLRGEHVPAGTEYRVLTKSGETLVEFNAVLIDYEGQPMIRQRHGRHRSQARRGGLRPTPRLGERRAVALLARRQVASVRKNASASARSPRRASPEPIGVGIPVASIRERCSPTRTKAAAIGRAVGYLNDVVEHLRAGTRACPMLLHDLGSRRASSLAAGSGPDRPVEIRPRRRSRPRRGRELASSDRAGGAHQRPPCRRARSC